MADPTSNPVEEVINAAKTKGDLTNDEKEKMQNFANIMASKVIYDYLQFTVNQYAAESKNPHEKTKEAAKICNKIRKLYKFNYTGSSEMMFKEHGFIFKMQLSMVDADYKLSIEIPKKYVQEAYRMIGFLLKTAQTFYQATIIDSADIIKEIADFAPDVDFSQLYYDKNNATLFFSEKTKKRIGPFCYYLNSARKPLAKLDQL